MAALRDLMSRSAAEAVGTFVIVFAGCGAIMVGERYPGSVPAAAVPIVFGLAVTAMVYAVGHISGAHFNPAVTIGFTLCNGFSRRYVFWYLAAQCFGALAAISACYLLLPAGAGYGATVARVDPLRALGWEAILTFVLMFVIMGVATDCRAVGTMAGAAVGATVILNAYVGGPVSGASMNPARSLAPALYEGRFSDLWIYVAGPIIGAVAAAYFYNKTVRCEDSEHKPPDAQSSMAAARERAEDVTTGSAGR